jgi:uncharacterized membrane protein
MNMKKWSITGTMMFTLAVCGVAMVIYAKVSAFFTNEKPDKTEVLAFLMIAVLVSIGSGLERAVEILKKELQPPVVVQAPEPPTRRVTLA